LLAAASAAEAAGRWEPSARGILAVGGVGRSGDGRSGVAGRGAGAEISGLNVAANIF